GRVPELILLSAFLPPGDEAALTSHLRAVPTAGHLELITIPMLEHAPGFDEGRRGLFGMFGRKKQNELRVDTRTFANELRAHLDRIAEAAETNALRKRREAPRAAVIPEPEPEESAADDSEQWTGLQDSFGERRFSMDDKGQPIELLRLASEFTSARDAIADRIVRLMDVYRPTL